jgi:PTH1 family peptidyl-tRNA hydrolase
MSKPRLIVGLGNPTDEHTTDRHNAGFWFVDALARSHGATLRRETRFHGLVGKARIGQDELWLLQPQTYMNRSGQAVAALARFYRIDPVDVLVAYDELDLSPGAARLKLGGSSTHNGLRDITAQFGGPGYWRLRLGIGHPRDVSPGKPVADYVLGRPSREHQAAIDDAIARAQDVLPLIAAGDWTRATQQLHSADPTASAPREKRPPSA